MKKIIALLSLCVMGTTAMAAESKTSKSSPTQEQSPASLCRMDVRGTTKCPNGKEVFQVYGTIVYWCDTGVVRNDLSHISEVSYEEACEGHMFRTYLI